MLRTILVLSIIAAGVRYSLKSPFYALLFYIWLAYFRPEQWVWIDFVSQLNLSLIVGVWILAYTVGSGQRMWFGLWPALFFLFLAQGLLATVTSTVFDYAFRYWQEFAKVIIVSYMMMVLVTTEERLRTTLVVMAFSLGLEGAKQGWAQLVLNPGAKNDNGWVMLGDNNGVAIGMLMLASYVMALVATSTRRSERYIGRFVAIGVVYRALSTYSRGAFLAAIVLGIQYIARSKQKLVGIVAVIVVGGVIVQVLPDSFWDRMSTIRTAAEITTGEEVDPTIQMEESAAGRLHFWQVAINMANDRPFTGVGQNAFNATYDRYDFSGGQYGRARSVHSAWFGILAELGYPGILLLVALIAHGFIVCRRARRLAKKNPDMVTLARYAAGIEGALVAFAVAGTFFPFSYNEMIWHALALSIILDRLINERVASAHNHRNTMSAIRPPASVAAARAATHLAR